MIRTLHVSDLHFGRPAVPEQIDAIEELIQSSRFDVVVISGDLSQRARSGELLRARAFIRDAERVSRTIVVPGNHDVKWWRAPFGMRRRDDMYDAYRTYISADLEPVLRVDGMTFVGVNTAHGVGWHTLTWNVRDIGVVGDVRRGQIDRVGEAFAASPPDDLRAVVMHHNPMKGELSQRHGLVNTKRALGAFADLGVDIVFCGHDHQEAIHYVEHTKRGTIISTAGTVSNRSRGGRPSSLNIVTVENRKFDISTWVWSRADLAFVQGPVRSFAH